MYSLSLPAQVAAHSGSSYAAISGLRADVKRMGQGKTSCNSYEYTVPERPPRQVYMFYKY